MRPAPWQRKNEGDVALPQHYFFHGVPSFVRKTVVVVSKGKRTRQALDHWKETSDTRPEALMFPSEKSGVPFTSRNWLERNLQPVGRNLGISTPLTFQVLRRSFATHNQKQLKDVQAHLGHESSGTTADLYVVEIPDEVRTHAGALCG
jgi:integrase